MIFTSFVALSLVTSFSQAYPTPEPRPYLWFGVTPYCSRFFSAESYAFAQAAGLGKTSEKPAQIDQICFEQGLFDGKKLAMNHKNNARACDRAFEDGKKQGLNAGIPVLTDPAECFFAGHAFGQAMLSNGAREQNTSLVGSTCVRAYKKGLSDGNENLFEETTTDNKEAYCYLTGYNDAILSAGN